MKDFQEKIREFLKDLTLTIPYLESYEIMDWSLLIITFFALVLSLKNRHMGLAVLVTSDLGWGFYDLWNQEYAQGILFLVYAALTLLFLLPYPKKEKKST